MADSRGRVAFAVGTGRCGTTFLARALAREPAIAAIHQRAPLVETFHRYCAWYRLAVDREGLFKALDPGIEEDLATHRLAMETSPYLSLNVAELHERYGARVILLVRSPQRVVASLLRKGWYADPVVRGDPDLAPGLTGDPARAHHHFGRLVPCGELYERWSTWTRVGKLAWYWSALNGAVLERFEAIPESHRRIVRLEAFDHQEYRSLVSFLGFEATLGRGAFEDLVASRPNRAPGAAPAAWSDREVAEFEENVAEMSEQLGYDGQARRAGVESIDSPIPHRPASASARVLSKVRTWLSRSRGQS